jgi:hypothetical protein
MTGAAQFPLAALAAAAAGAVNALAGGGTLITFPALVALGIPPVSANVTNTVALCPGYLGGTLAQKSDLRARKAHLWALVPAGLAGGLAGGLLLLHTGERMFRELMPFLILLACGLLALQEPVRSWQQRRARASAGHAPGLDRATPGPGPRAQADSRASTGEGGPGSGREIARAFVPIALASVYGGYFGAGLSVILLAVLALVLEDSLTRLNALKQAIAFAANLAAAAFFIFSGKVVWPIALVMAGAALLGGMAGGRLAGRIRPATLRWVVVGLGCAVAVVYLVR